MSMDSRMHFQMEFFPSYQQFTCESFILTFLTFFLFLFEPFPFSSIYTKKKLSDKERETHAVFNLRYEWPETLCLQ